MNIRHSQLELPFSQRWTAGKGTFRPPGEVIRTYEYEVASIPDDTTAKAFVIANHYSRSYPSARFRYGLYRLGRLVGVVVFSHPCRNDVLTSVFPGKATDSVECGRLVILDEVPFNGESYFMARAFDRLRREGVIGVLSFSDPVPRTSLGGATIFPGHLGVCYQALNASYLGRSSPRRLRLLPDGNVLSDHAVSKIRALDRGWRYAAAFLERHGADSVWLDAPKEWLNYWLPRLTRPLRHHGNHKYAWPLVRSVRRVLPPSLPYPKRPSYFAVA